MHAADTLREGEFLADYEKVETLCKNAPDAINELVTDDTIRVVALYESVFDSQINLVFVQSKTDSVIGTGLAALTVAWEYIILLLERLQLLILRSGGTCTLRICDSYL